MGYYRRFIKGFGKVTLPLRKLLIGLESQGKKAAKHTPVDWGEEEKIAFDTLKSLCCKAPILAYPNYKLPFILHTDSSLEGLGAVLYQVQNGVKRVIAYASRSVNKTEMNYPVHKLEFLALKWAITDKFHDYLYGGNTFDVYTDNNPLTYVLSTAKLDACMLMQMHSAAYNGQIYLVTLTWWILMRQLALSPSRPYVAAVESLMVIVKPYVVEQLVCQVSLLTFLLVLHSPLIG